MLNFYINKVKRVILSTFIGNIYFNFLLWLDFKKDQLNRANKFSKTQTKMVYSAVKASYNEGFTKIRDKITTELKNGNREHNEKVLEKTEELLKLAEEEKLQKDIELLRQACYYKDKDIQNDTQMAHMVERRIKDFKELHAHKERRQKLREQRKADKNDRK